MRRYSIGAWSDITQAAARGSAAGGITGAGRALLIRVRDVPQLVREKGGGVGTVAQKVLPDTVEQKVYSDMRSKFLDALSKEGVSADISVVSASDYKPAGVSTVWRALALGFGVALVGVTGWEIAKRYRKKGKG